MGPLNQSLQPTQNRKNFNSPYSKNYNEQYYLMAQIAKRQQNQMRQSSQLPARGSKRFYTIDPDSMSKGKHYLNNMTSAQYMGRGRKSVNRYN